MKKEKEKKKEWKEERKVLIVCDFVEWDNDWSINW